MYTILKLNIILLNKLYETLYNNIYIIKYLHQYCYNITVAKLLKEEKKRNKQTKKG